MAKVGENLSLDVQLYDYDTTMFVRARLYADGVETAYSPVPVPHLDNGYYYSKNPLVVYPANTSHFSIVYEVYRDAGYTTLSKRHAPYSEHYTEDSNEITDIGDNVLDKIVETVKQAIAKLFRVDFDIEVEEETVVSLVPEQTDELLLSVDEEQEVTVEASSQEIEIDVYIEKDGNIEIDTPL